MIHSRSQSYIRPSGFLAEITKKEASFATRLFFSADLISADNTGRTSFRSTLSQPSQMGNFKHHSLRGELTRTDRERERERDRDRDNERDKEGHERLRSVCITFS